MQKCHLQLGWLTPSTQPYYRSPRSFLRFIAKHFSRKKENPFLVLMPPAGWRKTVARSLKTEQTCLFFFLLPYLTTKNVTAHLHLFVKGNDLGHWKGDLFSLHGLRYLLVETSSSLAAGGSWEGENKTSSSSFCWCCFCAWNCSWLLCPSKR